MTDVVIKGIRYRVGKLPAMQQFHVVRRLAPAVWALIEVAAKSDAATPDDLTDQQALAAVGPLALAVSGMSDENSEYVLRTCLGACQREDSGKFAPVMAKGGGMLYDDIDMATMMQLALAVIKDNMGNFLDSLPGKAAAQPSA